jgi:hypothetical protein
MVSTGTMDVHYTPSLKVHPWECYFMVTPGVFSILGSYWQVCFSWLEPCIEWKPKEAATVSWFSGSTSSGSYSAAIYGNLVPAFPWMWEAWVHVALIRMVSMSTSISYGSILSSTQNHKTLVKPQCQLSSALLWSNTHYFCGVAFAHCLIHPMIPCLGILLQEWIVPLANEMMRTWEGWWWQLAISLESNTRKRCWRHV